MPSSSEEAEEADQDEDGEGKMIAGGRGESTFRGRLTPDFVLSHISPDAARGMGLAGWDSGAPGLAHREKTMLARANEILGVV